MIHDIPRWLDVWVTMQAGVFGFLLMEWLWPQRRTLADDLWAHGFLFFILIVVATVVW